MKTRLCFIFIVFMLTSCGYHLRGWNQESIDFGDLYVESRADAEFNALLDSSLNQHKVTRVTEKESAQYLLVIHQRDKQKRIASVDSEGRAREYELLHRLVFSFADVQGQLVSRQREIVTRQDMRFSSDALLAKEQEARQTFDDMALRAVNTMFRQLSVMMTKQD